LFQRIDIDGDAFLFQMKTGYYLFSLAAVIFVAALNKVIIVQECDARMMPPVLMPGSK
jgi:hypothetical protein